MGCCSSSGSSAPLNPGNSNSVDANKPAKSQSIVKKEGKVELAFRAKRANIFTEAVDLGRQAYVEKKIPKSAKQASKICKFLISFQVYFC